MHETRRMGSFVGSRDTRGGSGSRHRRREARQCHREALENKILGGSPRTSAPAESVPIKIDDPSTTKKSYSDYIIWPKSLGSSSPSELTDNLIAESICSTVDSIRDLVPESYLDNDTHHLYITNTLSNCLSPRHKAGGRM